jgi:phenylpropionate dioxygenase-like ring-hydroxylating dioxygenase large terminal subunit
MNVETMPQEKTDSALRPDFIPREDYVREDLPKIERARLWPRVWQLACREEELPQVGSFVKYDILEESFLVVRTSPEEIKAFYNVCPHRGRRLKTAPSGNIAKGLMCGFHGWQFDVQGRVTNIPGREDWADCQTFREKELALVQPKLARWGGAVWINMDPKAPPLLDYLAEAAEKLANFELQDLRLHWYKTIHMPVGWKVVMEAFMEGYHSTATHPQMFKYGDMRWPGPLDQGLNTTHTTEMHAPRGVDPRKNLKNMIIELHDTLHSMFLKPAHRAAERLTEELPAEATESEVHQAFWDFQKEEIEKSGARWPKDLKMQDLWSTVWHLFPNSSVLPTVDGALWYRVRPSIDNYNHSIFDIWSLGRYAPGKEPNPPHEIYESLEAFKGQNAFLEQDFSNLLAVEQGIKSRAWRGARPNPVQEVTVWAFHRNLRRYLGELAPLSRKEE